MKYNVSNNKVSEKEMMNVCGGYNFGGSSGGWNNKPEEQPHDVRDDWYDF